MTLANQVLLRRPVRADAPALIAANKDNRDYHRPWVEPFADEAGFESWFTRFSGDRHAGFLAEDPANGGIVGIININEIVRGAYQGAFLGYYGMAAFARRGLMTEAMRRVIRVAFDELGLHRLEANIQPGNTRSIALVKRLGFTLEGFSPRYLKVCGEWRDHERWAILAD